MILPVRDHPSTTRQCLDELLAFPGLSGDGEIVVVDDASDMPTRLLLDSYGERVRLVRHESSVGFASACNSGAATSSSEYLIFLSNDTIPQPGWLDALVAYAVAHPFAAVVGSLLLFPDDTVQHAGLVICQDRYPRHIYAGFPFDHPAVQKSRRFQAVGAACALFRRDAFEQAKGFDAGSGNGYEDVDLCLRLGELGYEVHYCHESVVYHLDSATRAHGTEEQPRNDEEWRRRWMDRVRPDDVDYYASDGLLRVDYPSPYAAPTFSISPALGAALGGRDDDLADRLLHERTRRSLRLRQENARLKIQIRELGGLSESPGSLRLHAKRGASPEVLADGRIHHLSPNSTGRLVSVLLPTKNGSTFLPALLRSILSQQFDGDLEIVAVDSGSSDNSVEILAEFGAKTVVIPPSSFDHGLTRMLAVSHAGGQAFVFVNQSALPCDEHWLANLVAPLDADPELAGVCSRLLPRPDADPLTSRDGHSYAGASAERRISTITDWDAYRQLDPHNLRLLLSFHTVSAAIRPQVLEMIPFREVTYIGEDLVWAREVLEAGFKLQHEPRSRVWHSHQYSYLELLGRNLDDGMVNADCVGLRLSAADVLPLIERSVSDDWRYLLEAFDPGSPELERWRLASVLRRTAQAVGQWIGANHDLLPNSLVDALSLTRYLRDGGAGSLIGISCPRDGKMGSPRPEAGPAGASAEVRGTVSRKHLT